jgi:hypothetical protein
MFKLVITSREKWQLDAIPQELPSPGFEIVVLMNFVTIVLIHYLFTGHL